MPTLGHFSIVRNCDENQILQVTFLFFLTQGRLSSTEEHPPDMTLYSYSGNDSGVHSRLELSSLSFHSNFCHHPGHSRALWTFHTFVSRILGLFFFAWATGMWDLSFLTRDPNRTSQQRRPGVLTTGPPGKSLGSLYFRDSLPALRPH